MHISSICEDTAKGVEGDHMCLSTASSNESHAWWTISAHAHNFRGVRSDIASISLTGQMLVQAMPDGRDLLGNHSNSVKKRGPNPPIRLLEWVSSITKKEN